MLTTVSIILITICSFLLLDKELQSTDNLFIIFIIITMIIAYTYIFSNYIYFDDTEQGIARRVFACLGCGVILTGISYISAIKFSALMNNVKVNIIKMIGKQKIIKIESTHSDKRNSNSCTKLIISNLSTIYKEIHSNNLSMLFDKVDSIVIQTVILIDYLNLVNNESKLNLLNLKYFDTLASTLKNYSDIKQISNDKEWIRECESNISKGIQLTLNEIKKETEIILGSSKLDIEINTGVLSKIF